MLTVITLPFASVWLFVHPFIAGWRRVGPFITYAFIIGYVTCGIYTLWSFRRWILSVEYGFHGFLAFPAALFLLFAFVLRVSWRRVLRPRTLLGVPEITGKNEIGKLAVDGVYSHIRHPRYVEVGFALTAAALFSNYLSSYIAVLLYVPIIYCVALLEERELKRRFGKAYEDYCSRVPRFIPRIRLHDGRGFE